MAAAGCRVALWPFWLLALLLRCTGRVRRIEVCYGEAPDHPSSDRGQSDSTRNPTGWIAEEWFLRVTRKSTGIHGNGGGLVW